MIGIFNPGLLPSAEERKPHAAPNGSRYVNGAPTSYSSSARCAKPLLLPAPDIPNIPRRIVINSSIDTVTPGARATTLLLVVVTLRFSPCATWRGLSFRYSSYPCDSSGKAVG